MLDDDLRYRIEVTLNETISGVSPVSGGCTSDAIRLHFGSRSLFVKWGIEKVAATFGAESRGLSELARAASLIRIPGVIEHISLEDRRGALILEWIEGGVPRAETWKRLGEGLAEIHRWSHEDYGFGEDNYIGSSAQSNSKSDDWITFFRECRLMPQVRMARSRDHWPRKWDGMMDRLCLRLDDIIPARPYISLVHGDLWKGNILVEKDGNPVLIDPAVYYGHREVDLAMSTLFGSLDAAFYEAYSSAWPLETGYAERAKIYNLYHLINHLNLFGDAYAASVEAVLRRF